MPASLGEDIRLQDCLIQYCAADVMSGANQYECAKCDGKRDANTWASFSKLPEVMLVSLKRFKRTYSSSSSVYTSKISR